MEALRYLREALTANWGLKILALALAIVLYHSIKDSAGNRHNDRNNDRRILQGN